MADAVPDAPRLAVGKLGTIVKDGDELRKGAQIFDDKGLANLARFQNKLYADAAGSGASPYKVQVQFVEEGAKARCSCMAARSRPFCKHAAALLVAWARAPEGFVLADVAPAPAGDAKKKAVKAGKTDAASLMKGGIEQVATLVRELALTGVAALGAGRAEQVRALGESLREHKLRRLSVRTVALAARIGQAGSDHGRFDAGDYAELVADTFLTVRKLEKHVAGEALDDKYVEELVGKTWTKKDRKPVGPLDLVEYGFIARVTPDNFVIRESRFVDLASGGHYSEKQIIPAFLAARTEGKKSHAGWVLARASASQYPSFPPHRLDLEDPGERISVGDPQARVFDLLLEKCLPTVTAALAAFQEHRKDVFAPEAFPVGLRVDTVLAEHAWLQAVDREGTALFLPDDPALEEQLAGALRNCRLEALFGDIVLSGALPTLVPMAALVATGNVRELRQLGGGDTAALLSTRKIRQAAGPATSNRTAWVDTARAAGLSPAPVALGEVREELAEILVTGLASLTTRRVEALTARLAELGLAKPADVLNAAAARADAAEKFDDFVKVYQVLGIAMTRLAGAAHVDRSALMPVPTYESVQVQRSEELLAPRDTAARVARGELNRYQAAVRYAAWYERIPAEELVANVYPTWADGAASPFVARAFATRPAEALQAARGVLTNEGHSKQWWSGRAHARVARLTAINVLAQVGTKEAAGVLSSFAGNTKDQALRSLARRALRAMGSPDASPAVHPEYPELRADVVGAPNKAERVEAIRKISRLGIIEAIPLLRASLAGDVATDVREAAAMALGELGDTESVDTFVRMVRMRAQDPAQARVGAYALGWLGDVRGIDALLDAWADVWQPQIVGEAMKHIGMAALDPLIDRIEKVPDLIKRKAALGVIESLNPAEVGQALTARLDRLANEPDFIAKATLYLALAQVNPAITAQCRDKILSLRPGIAEKGASKEEKALFRKCQPKAAQAP